MHQALIPPGGEFNMPQASEPRERREKVRTISLGEQEALEQAPFFDAFCAWLFRLAQTALARQDTPQPPEAA